MDDHFARAAGQCASCGCAADAGGSRRAGDENAVAFSVSVPGVVALKVRAPPLVKRSVFVVAPPLAITVLPLRLVARPLPKDVV